MFRSEWVLQRWLVKAVDIVLAAGQTTLYSWLINYTIDMAFLSTRSIRR